VKIVSIIEKRIMLPDKLTGDLDYGRKIKNL
jgi:hypothetical protein